jgi:hypothetical protein
MSMLINGQKSIILSMGMIQGQLLICPSGKLSRTAICLMDPFREFYVSRNVILYQNFLGAGGDGHV